MFAYCNNNPVNFVDPSGCFLECFLDDCDITDDFDKSIGGGAGNYHYKGGSSTAGRSASYSGGFSSGRYTSNNSATRTYGKGGSKANYGQGFSSKGYNPKLKRGQKERLGL